MLKHNDRCTGLNYMEETLSYLALQGWYDIDSAKIFNLLSAADTWWNTRWAHLLCLQHCQKEPFFRPVSQQVHHLRETHVCGVCRSIKLTSLRDASVDFGIPNFEQLFLLGVVLNSDNNTWIMVIRCIHIYDMHNTYACNIQVGQ